MLKKISLTIGIIFVVLGILIILLLIFYAFFETPFSPEKTNLPYRFSDITETYILGTDQYGRDIYSRLIIGGQNSLFICIIALFSGIFIGLPLGLLASFLRGWIDEGLMRFNDIIFAFPALMTAIMLSSIYGPRKLNAIIALGIFNIPIFAHFTRNTILHIWQQDFVLAALALGCSKIRVIFFHIFPSFFPLLVVQASTQFSIALLAEAGLSYLGLGTPPLQPSWGKMLYEMQTFSFQRPQLVILPGFCIVILVLSGNIISDYLQYTFGFKKYQ